MLILFGTILQIVKLEYFDLSYFLGKNFFVDDCLQNMFVYQPAFIKLDLIKDKVAEYIFAWK